MNSMEWPSKFWVVGTDTDVGKTVVSAALCAALNYSYFKPVQSGSKTDSDSRTVNALCTGKIPILEEVYRLTEPLSPHRAAELDGIEIDVDIIAKAIAVIPEKCLVEAAGGLFVPITRKIMQIEVVAESKLPVVLVSRTSLGTINHTLLSVEALKNAQIPLFALVFSGESNPDNIRTISENLSDSVHIFHFPRVNLESTSDFQQTAHNIFLPQ